MLIDLEETFNVGEDTFFRSNSPIHLPYVVTFEDDLQTGYFYAIDSTTKKIIDALHIYNVADVVDKEKPCKLQIAWTEDGMIASLLINDYCHAIFDFKNRGGYCRTGFPETKQTWAINKERKLTDAIIERIFAEVE